MYTVFRIIDTPSFEKKKIIKTLETDLITTQFVALIDRSFNESTNQFLSETSSQSEINNCNEITVFSILPCLKHLLTYCGSN